MGSILSGRHGITPGLAVTGFGLNTITEFGAGAGIAALYATQSHTKAGKHVPAIAALVGKLLAAGTLAAGYNKSRGGLGNGAYLLGGIFNSIGSAGVALAGAHYIGLDWGRKRAGYIVGRAKALPAGVEPVHGIGALPPAPAGETLTWPQLMALSEMR